MFSIKISSQIHITINPDQYNNAYHHAWSLITFAQFLKSYHASNSSHSQFIQSCPKLSTVQKFMPKFRSSCSKFTTIQVKTFKKFSNQLSSTSPPNLKLNNVLDVQQIQLKHIKGVKDRDTPLV